MLEEILPMAATAEVRSRSIHVKLFRTEEDAIRQSVPKRRREFTTGRACARLALAKLGLSPMPINVGTHGQPEWPTGVVGSITHCEGFCGCALAWMTDLVGVGIDAEPNEPLPEGILMDIASDPEVCWVREATRRMPSVCWDRMLFSIKESVYKAWYPLTERRLNFDEVETKIAPWSSSFHARLLVPGPVRYGHPITVLSGRWCVDDDLIVTAVAVPTVPS